MYGLSTVGAMVVADAILAYFVSASFPLATISFHGDLVDALAISRHQLQII